MSAAKVSMMLEVAGREVTVTNPDKGSSPRSATPSSTWCATTSRWRTARCARRAAGLTCSCATRTGWAGSSSTRSARRPRGRTGSRWFPCAFRPAAAPTRIVPRDAAALAPAPDRDPRARARAPRAVPWPPASGGRRSVTATTRTRRIGRWPPPTPCGPPWTRASRRRSRGTRSPPRSRWTSRSRPCPSSSRSWAIATPASTARPDRSRRRSSCRPARSGRGRETPPGPPRYRKRPVEPPLVQPSKRIAALRRGPRRPLIEIARAGRKQDALAGLERWKARHPAAAARLEPADILVDAMRGRFTTWTRIHVNLEHVPEELRPAHEPLDPDDEPG